MIVTQRESVPRGNRPDPGDVYAAAYNDDPKEFDRLFDAALRAERLAVVEELRAMLIDAALDQGSAFDAMLDEVAWAVAATDPELDEVGVAGHTEERT